MRIWLFLLAVASFVQNAQAISYNFHSLQSTDGVWATGEWKTADELGFRQMSFEAETPLGQLVQPMDYIGRAVATVSEDGTFLLMDGSSRYGDFIGVPDDLSYVGWTGARVDFSTALN